MRIPLALALAALVAGFGNGCGSVTAANDGGGGNGGSGGGSGGSGGTGGSVTCSPGCGSGSVCVGTVTNGGVAILSDGGVCPTGSHSSGSAGICQNDPSYSCQPTPGECNGTVTCSCAQSLCQNGRQCQSASNAMVMCVQEVP